MMKHFLIIFRKAALGLFYALTVSLGVLASESNVEPIAPKDKFVSIDSISLNSKWGQLDMNRRCTNSSSIIEFNTKLNLTSEVYHEAKMKNIKQDKVVISLKRDENCDITHFSIDKKGQLESMNDLAKQFCADLIQNVDWDIIDSQNCPALLCTKITIPFNLNLK